MLRVMTGPRNTQHQPNLGSIRASAEEYARGVAGGMLFSVPILYTMEVWTTGFIAGPLRLLGYVVVSFCLLLGYNRYAGMRADSSFLEVAIDSVEEMGLGLLIAALVLYLLGRITTAMPVSEIVAKIVVEAMNIAIGVSVGTAQLGGSSEESGKRGEGDQPHTGGQLVLALCGAVLFAANIAPTDEILVIAAELPQGKLLGLAALSLLVGALILYLSDFVGSRRHVRNGKRFWVCFGLITSYGAALLASTLMLWFFGRLAGGSVPSNVAQIVVLAFPAMLGASAGRLLIQ